MTTNIVLKSQNSMSYASGKAVFKMNWATFLEDPNSEYLVSFSYISEVNNTLDEDDLYVLSLDNIALLKNIQGGQYNSSTSTEIGIIYSEEPHSSHTRLKADHSTNPPVTLYGRPTQDILEISLRDLTGTLMQKTPQFVLFLRFEKV
jgi:hypothetical protein